MKKLIIIIMLLFLTSCSVNNINSNDSSTSIEIPVKINPNGVNVQDSSINTTNLDNFLFRDDVFYVDVRFYSWVLSDGYISGFNFVPYYNFLAARSGDNALFTMSGGSELVFTPIYNESINLLEDIFPKDKKIFIVSQSGVEGGYLSTLLIQNGYDIEDIYNIGGVTNSTGYPSYRSIGKNFVKGTGIFGEDTRGEFVEVDFAKFREKSKLTFIK